MDAPVEGEVGAGELLTSPHSALESRPGPGGTTFPTPRGLGLNANATIHPCRATSCGARAVSLALQPSSLRRCGPASARCTR